ncbi:MAG: fibronectin type III domain-containing protein [Anaerovoracaceae bacterium]|jgi:hypothetical protein
MESKAEKFSGSQKTIIDLDGYYSNKVTVTGLNENTTYYYQLFQDRAWKNAVKYETKSTSNFSFLLDGDPQIVGASKKQVNGDNETLSTNDSGDPEKNLAARNDAYNWNIVLNYATAKYPNVSLMISAGDQINSSENEAEFAGYLNASALKSLPVATTIRNHDSGTVKFCQHFNTLNV